MTDPVLTQLLAADSALAAQETHLRAQLDTIQNQRDSLQSVLEIFEAEATPAADKEIEIAPARIAVEPDSTPAETIPQRRRRRKTTKAKTQKTPASPPSKTKARSQGWKGYLRDEYRQAPLTETISQILKSQPQKVFACADLVNLIFVEEIPNPTRKGARARVSNILAEGARKGELHHPKPGCYRFAK